MTRSDVDAIYAEYPFLSKLIARVDVSHAHVSRWSEEFLASRPDQYPDSGREKIYFLDEKGDIVTYVGARSLWDHLVTFFKGVDPSETVHQTLARIAAGEVQRIRYAVGIWNGRVILHKLPRDYHSASDWLCSVVTKARKELQDD